MPKDPRYDIKRQYALNIKLLRGFLKLRSHRKKLLVQIWMMILCQTRCYAVFLAQFVDPNVVFGMHLHINRTHFEKYIRLPQLINYRCDLMFGEETPFDFPIFLWQISSNLLISIKKIR